MGEFLTTIKDALTAPYRAYPGFTTVCVYLLALFGAFVVQQNLKKWAKEIDAEKSAQTIVEQKAVDSTCSNISAGGSVNVECPQTKDDNDKENPHAHH